jgi:hypothetical protein
MIYKYVFYSMLINYLFVENIPVEINNLLFLMRYYCFFITNLLFCCNISMISMISTISNINMNDNLMKNYLISNGVYIIDYIIIGNTKYINLGDYYNYYNIPILIFKLIIIYYHINNPSITQSDNNIDNNHNNDIDDNISDYNHNNDNNIDDEWRYKN